MAVIYAVAMFAAGVAAVAVAQPREWESLWVIGWLLVGTGGVGMVALAVIP